MPMSLQGFFDTALASIQHIGTLYFIGMIAVDIILWRIHPALGTIGALAIIVFLMNLF